MATKYSLSSTSSTTLRLTIYEIFLIFESLKSSDNPVFLIAVTTLKTFF